MTNPFAHAVKFLKAVNLLASPNGTTVRGLADGLNISRRSVFRLLQALEELGFPISDEHSKRKTEKTYRLAGSYVLKLPNIAVPNPCLTTEETILVLSALDARKKRKLSGETRTLNSAKGKLAAMLPAGKR